MGFRFRKSIKLAPGVRINLTKKGVSSLSVGKRGATVNVGKKGTRTTVGIPGSGLSHSSYKAHGKSSPKSQAPLALAQNDSNSNRPPPPPTYTIDNNTNSATGQRQVSILLGIGIFLVPIIFAWFTLRQGYSTVSRAISMVWMVIVIFSLR